MQAFTHAESSPMMNMSPSHLTPHFSQFPPSRLGQQPAQRFSHGRSMGAGGRGGEWNHHAKVQTPLSNYSSAGQRSPGSNNNAPWGMLKQPFLISYIDLFLVGYRVKRRHFLIHVEMGRVWFLVCNRKIALS